MCAKISEKLMAIKLRKKGKSYSDILKEIRVSRSTLSLWLRDIPLAKKQRDKLIGRAKSRYLGSKKRQRLRVENTIQILGAAKIEAYELIKNELFLSGLMLYWAEGTKRGEVVNFSNSDPKMISLMMRWFRELCVVPKEKFRIQIHAHSLHQTENIKDFWHNKTKVPLNQFHKIIIKKTSLGHRKNILYQGTCCIRVNDVKLFRRIMGWKIGVLECFGIKDSYNIPK